MLNIEFFELGFIAINLVMVMFGAYALFHASGLISNVDARNELSQKDNAAFGVSLSGAILGMWFMLSGVTTGEVTENSSYINEFVVMGLYGIIGIVCMAIARHLIDKWGFEHISLHDEIMKGNMSAAIIDAGNMIASGLVCYFIMDWLKDDSLYGVVLALFGFVFGQVILGIATAYRSTTYTIDRKMRLGSNNVSTTDHNGDGKETIDDQVHNGNIAFSLRFVGYRIGAAICVGAATNIYHFGADALKTFIVLFLVSLAVLMFYSVISFWYRKFIFEKIDYRAEVDEQKNVAIGAMEAALYIGFATCILTLVK